MLLTKRQKEILDFITLHIEQRGYAPTLEEIGRNLGLSSVATIHKHLVNLEARGAIKRGWNRNRSIELTPGPAQVSSLELPLLGEVAAGHPIEALTGDETISVPEDMVRKGAQTYVLRVTGSSMIDEHIRSGDYVIVENRLAAHNGETVIALIDGREVTVKKYFREESRIRLQPANPNLEPLYFSENQVTIQGVVIGVMRKY